MAKHRPNPSNQPDTCAWCGAYLNRLLIKDDPNRWDSGFHTEANTRGGYRGTTFCTMACALQFAVQAHTDGVRYSINPSGKLARNFIRIDELMGGG